MLAYVFWHVSVEDADATEYADRLVDFHQSLYEDPPDGYRGSVVLRHYALPWAPPSLFVYEDWYLVDDFRALGALNEAAVSTRHKEGHDAAASRAKWGAGGVYRPGNGCEPAASFAYWFAKPPGWSYADLDARLGSERAGLIWQRQMVLGPAPELCLRTSRRIDLELEDVFESAAHTVYAQT